jgi:hypothetical protein
VLISDFDKWNRSTRAVAPTSDNRVVGLKEARLHGWGRISGSQ